ncbi:uncharacterized protein LOC104893970 [Beta vulgaris subsp. vulgaris]|uniref:uncharacterized protein LOC104893970 n=1 Tax=Beta vulgaris subsp. vulgaris TaxID=3555 RepID=UPI0025494351|nr:uncharacterized protein LOC104893970 [Beta vulgaris subsp. vulgaris]
MYEPLNQPSYTNISYLSTQSFPPTIPNPPHNFHSLSSDHSLSHPPPPFNSLSSVPSFSHPLTFNPYIDSGHYPSNYAGFGAPPVNYSGTNNDVTPSWVVKQAAPIKYSPAIHPLRQEATASTSYAAPMNHKPVSRQLVTNVPKKKLKRPRAFPNKSSVSQNVRCEVCKVECSSVDVYAKHLSGKKHGKGLLKLYAPGLQSAATPMQASQSANSSGKIVTPDGQGVPRPNQSANLEVKKQKLLEGGAAAQSMRTCAICNVACNGEIAFADHVVGKKHVAKERARSVNSNPVSVGMSETKAQQTPTKKKKSGESAPVWCVVCKISCTSSDGLKIHLAGKKHQKNVQKLQTSNSSTITTPASISAPLPSTAAPLPSTNPSTGVEGNTAATKISLPEPQKAKKKGPAKEPKDVETKKRNILESGAAADAVRTCTICNVVCNSETVFNSHCAGQQAEAASSGLHS